MTMSREQWQALSPLLTEAMELPEAARESWLAELDTSQPALSPLLRTLLLADRRAEQGKAFETASILVSPSERAASEWRADQRIGPYQLRRPLGRGGMGDVWLARQVDGGITRDVALKLPALIGQPALWRERFRRERDILASLQHPNIATLFDAGVADLTEGSAQPYLAMEYVEGASLLDHAAHRDLSLRERITLFRQLLAAVGQAHRGLVIHRDIKPSNILVTPGGQAKLLDFGIAKLIDDRATTDAHEDLTRLGGRLLTFRYAAPEQVLGESLGTATDIYALGVVLHELLTGQSPYSRVRRGEALGVGDFENPDLMRPSALAPDTGLAGDLDAIILTALRRDPARRYGTVEQFDDDLRRYLERRPVLARRGSRRYQAGRFILRHRLPLAAAAAVVLSLIAGLFVADRERRIAVAAQARAERHFASVRELANTFIRDIEEDLRGLAGTLPVREKLAKTSVRYLDSLSAETQLDPSLQADLAGGYRRVAEVFAGSGAGNLGNADAAIEYLRKAEALFDDLRSRGISSRSILQDEWRMHYTLSAIYLSRNDPLWEQESLGAIAALRKLADGPEATAYERITAAGVMIEHVVMLQDGQNAPPKASPLLEEGKSRLAAVGPLVGDDVRAKASLATGYFTLAQLMMEVGAPREDLERAVADLQSSGALFGEVVKQVPDDMAYAAMLDQSGTLEAEALLMLGRIAEAEALVEAVLVRSARNMARDRDNVDLLLVHWQALVQGTETAYRNGRMALAAQRAGDAWQLASTVPEEVIGRILESASSKATVDYYGGLALLATSDSQVRAACERLRAVEAVLPEIGKEFPDEAALQARFSELAAALKRCPVARRVAGAAPESN